MKSFIVIIIILVAIVGALFFVKFPIKISSNSPTPTATATATPMAKSDPKNTTYTIDGSSVTLIDGQAEKDIPDSDAVIDTYTFGEPVYGDLNGDGIDDAGIYLVQETGGTGVFYYAVAAISENGEFHGTNAVYIGDRIAPQNINIKEGVFIANYADRKPDEPFSAQPSVGVSKYLRFEDGLLKEAPQS